ncbi:hypothetical protein B0F90DRAFT_1776640 [Multifurca ochricompacta]|uniref:Uncharacterized protein n=1 Tax=Multifurca ochricompacta TaxID=376703 RepID=A0AAD4LWZ3_9AGAM|nr:hypothetical protein B0F90DRAFT_1776640 [Multifurca ochricompacta]
MSQSYPHSDPSLGSLNTSQTASGVNIQAAATGENPYAGRSGPSDEARNLSTSAAGYPVHFASAGENETWSQDTQDEWIPGFAQMDPQTRRDALNRYLQTPKITYESIVHAFLQQQQQQQQAKNMMEAQKKAAEKEALEREMRMRAEQQRHISRPDGQGLQPRRF